MIKGITGKTLLGLVKALGDDALNLIAKDPEVLRTIPGIGEKKAATIIKALQGATAEDKAASKLEGAGITPAIARGLTRKYGGSALHEFKSNPYLALKGIKGVGFKKADKLALKSGVDALAKIRIEAAAEEVVSMEESRGSTLVDARTMDAGVYALTGQEGATLTCGTHYQRPILEEAEKKIAAFCNRSITNSRIFRELEYGLVDEQKAAVIKALGFNTSIITGPPGSGKTRTIQTIFNEFSGRVALTAPTGRAAQRMGQVCDSPAMTIHRLLKFNPGSEDFQHNEINPLNYDMVIVDECSMLDTELAAALLSAIRPNTHVVLVGDYDQLPSVGPGRVFADIIESGIIPTTKLTKVFRQAEGSTIVELGRQVIRGEDSNKLSWGEECGFRYISRDSDKAAKELVSIIAHELVTQYGWTPDKTVVLTPKNDGPLGSVELNKELQRIFNPLGLNGDDEVAAYGVRFRIGDRVCQKINNYKIHFDGAFNGDIGTVTKIDPFMKSVWVTMWNGKTINYRGGALFQLALGYAVSIHKAQGSEYENVVLVAHGCHSHLLNSNLLYTGITRAKKKLLVAGSLYAFDIARGKTERRNTGLPLLLAPVNA